MKFGAQRLDDEDIQQDVVRIEYKARHGRPERQAARLGNPGECAAAGNGRGGWRGVGQADLKYHARYSDRMAGLLRKFMDWAPLSVSCSVPFGHGSVSGSILSRAPAAHPEMTESSAL